MEKQQDKIDRLKIQILRNYSDTLKFTQKQWVEAALKVDWLSNYEAQALVNSSSGDRYIRFVEAELPFGERLQKRVKDCPTYCLEYRWTNNPQREIWEVY